MPEIHEPRRTAKIAAMGIIAAISVLLIAILIFLSVYTLNEQENALVLTFDKYTSTETAGMHFKIPFVQTVERVDMTTQGRTFGYSFDNTGAEVQQPAEITMMMTKDVNVVNTYLYVEWQVSDPFKYTYNARAPLDVLDALTQSEAKRVLSAYNVDDALTGAKYEIQAAILSGINASLAKYDIGIDVKNITIQDIEPPTPEVIESFKAVENARQQKDTELNKARAYENQVLPDARANADKIIQEANAKKASRIAEAEGQVSRFNSLYSEFAKNPAITKARIYYETMEQVLPKMDVVFDGSDGNLLKMLDIGQTTEGSAAK